MIRHIAWWRKILYRTWSVPGGPVESLSEAGGQWCPSGVQHLTRKAHSGTVAPSGTWRNTVGTVPAFISLWSLPDSYSQDWESSLAFTRVGFQA